MCADLQAHSKSSSCADVRVGGSDIVFKASNRKSAPRWHGPAKILASGNAGVTSKFQGQTFKVAQYCVRKKPDAQDAGEGDWNPASGGSDT